MTKDCCEPKNKKKDKAKKADNVILWLMGGTVVITLLAVWLGMKVGKGVEVSADTSVAIEVEESSHDWGEIDIDGGVVTRTFKLANSGDSTLKLFDVKTSCMCTTAQLLTDSSSSRKFGMHEKSASVFEVAPGETAELLVEFDPMFHGPSGVGQISRQVNMQTNDPSKTSLSFKVSGNVVKN